jgi:hypothetical protein
MPTFAQLQDRVKDYLIDVPSTTSALVSAWLNKALRDAEKVHDFSHMEAEFEASTVENTRLLAAKPDRWKKPREAPYFLRDDGSTREMAWAADRQDMRRQFAEGDEDDDGPPMFLLEKDAELLVYPFPDGDSDHDDGEYRVHVPYWRYSPLLSAGGDTNWFTDNAEWYLTFQAVAEGMIMNRDTDEATLYLERGRDELRRVVTEDKRSRARQPRVLVPRRRVFGFGRQPPRKM